MRIVDRYITVSIARTFLSAILVFCFLYVLIDLATHMDDFISNKVPLLIVGEYYASFLPIIFVQTSPIASLLATLFTYSTLNNNNEIIALRATGFDFWRTTRPAIIFGLMITSLIFMVNERFVPGSMNASQDIKQDTIEARTKDAQKAQEIKNLFFYGLKDRLFFIDHYFSTSHTMEGITVISQDSQQRMTEKISAQKGTWDGKRWTFFNCQVATYDPLDNSRTDQVKFYKEYPMDMGETPKDLLTQRTRVANMNIQELSAYINRFQSSGAYSALNSLRVDLHQRIAYPFGCIVILLVGLPFALTTGRRKGLTFASVGIALAIGFLFFVVNSVGLALGKGGALPPIVAAWIAPVLFLIAGWHLVRKLF